MARPKNSLPTYRRHPRGYSARTFVNGGWVTLGPWDSPESHAEFARILAEVRATAGAVVAPADRKRVTVAELIAAFRVHAEEYYRRPDGTPTNEVKEFAGAARVLRELYGPTPTAEFGPVALQAVREKMIDAGWCRTRVNKQIGRVRRIFRWGVSQELLSVAVVDALDCVDGLKKNRSRATERDPVSPAPEADYRATLPCLVPTVQAMCQLQRLAGLRPGEVRLMTPEDIDRSGPVWVYRPEQHKMAHLGRDRASPLPSAARVVLGPFLAGAEPGKYLFTPIRAREEMFAAWRAKRKSKVPPSQQNRKKPAAELKKRSRERFTDHGYAAVIRRACGRAGVEPWAPNQLRHSFATEVRARFGLEAAQVLLGHARADVTQVYAARSWQLALEVVAEMDRR